MNLAIELVLEIMAYFCECIIQLLCIHAFLGRKIKINLNAILFIVSEVSLLTLLMHLECSGLWTLPVNLICLIYIMCELKLGFTKAIVLMMLNILVGASMQAIAILPAYILFNQIDNPSLIGLFVNVFALIFMVLFVKYIKFNRLYIIIIKWDRAIVSCLLLCGILFLYLLVRFKLRWDLVVLSYFASAIMICVVIVMIFYWQRDRYIVKQKNLELRMHEVYGKTVEGMLENIRIRQHDFKNQLAAIYGMHLTSANFEELVENQKEYCDYLMKESRYDSILTKCRDKILAGFLYTKFAECEKKGIEVDFDILVNDSHCKLTTYELIEIVGILLDNALEYEIENKNEKGIYIKIQDDIDQIKIVCRNKVEHISMDIVNKFFSKGFSTKGKGRGLGLYNVKKMMDGKGDIIVSNETIGQENWIQFQLNIDRK